jgi:hypothetical protein
VDEDDEEEKTVKGHGVERRERREEGRGGQ